MGKDSHKKKKKKEKKGKKHKKEKREKEKLKKLKKEFREWKKQQKEKQNSGSSSEEFGPMPPVSADPPRTLTPMTKEEYDKRQSVIRRVQDPVTGRTRLIKGDGEILEEPVSSQRHKEINKQATRGDGQYFQQQLQQRISK